MGLDRDRTRDPWICDQTRICSQTRYRLRYAARRKIKDIKHLEGHFHSQLPGPCPRGARGKKIALEYGRAPHQL